MELLSTLRNINWVDVIVLVIAVRIVYISAQTGFVIEFLKTLGAFAALGVAFHFYTALGGVAGKKMFSEGTLAAAAFAVLWIFTLLACKLIRDGLLLLFSVKAENALDKWGAVIISIGRAALTASMAMFLLLASGQKYFQRMTLASLSGQYILLVSPVIYRTTCDGFVTKLFPSQKKNPAVAEVLRGLVKK